MRPDYTRSKTISDHDYVRNMLMQAIEDIADGSLFPDDDSSDCNQAITEDFAYRDFLN